MRRALIVVVAALLFVPAANAYHVYSSQGFPHWPAASDGVLRLKLIDRTGYWNQWQQETLPTAKSRIKDAIDAPVSFSVTRGTRFELCPAPTYECRWNEAFAQTPVGSIFIAFHGSMAAWRECEYFGFPEPYCQGDPDHTMQCVVGVDSTLAVVTHELGHCLGLGHRKLDANYQCDGPSVMCALSYTRFDAHDRAELNRAEMYGHTP